MRQKSKKVFGLILLLASVGVHSAPISFIPQSASLDVAFVDIDPNAWLAVFDFDENPACDTGNPLFDCRLGNPLVIGNPFDPITADIVNIEPLFASHYYATGLINQSTIIPLFNSPRFIVAASFDQGTSWWNPFNVAFLGTDQNSNLDIFRIDYFGINTGNLQPRLSVALMLDASAAVVPVPAAMWLFSSGILGLIVVARRH